MHGDRPSGQHPSTFLRDASSGFQAIFSPAAEVRSIPLARCDSPEIRARMPIDSGFAAEWAWEDTPVIRTNSARAARAP